MENNQNTKGATDPQRPYMEEATNHLNGLGKMMREFTEQSQKTLDGLKNPTPQRQRQVKLLGTDCVFMLFPDKLIIKAPTQEVSDLIYLNIDKEILHFKSEIKALQEKLDACESTYLEGCKAFASLNENHTILKTKWYNRFASWLKS